MMRKPEYEQLWIPKTYEKKGNEKLLTKK
jgi:hypothetical protein